MTCNVAGEVALSGLSLWNCCACMWKTVPFSVDDCALYAKDGLCPEKAGIQELVECGGVGGGKCAVPANPVDRVSLLTQLTRFSPC